MITNIKTLQVLRVLREFPEGIMKPDLAERSGIPRDRISQHVSILRREGWNVYSGAKNDPYNKNAYRGYILRGKR
jgi:DNA-binding IclR family transcriptional regulator